MQAGPLAQYKSGSRVNHVVDQACKSLYHFVSLCIREGGSPYESSKAALSSKGGSPPLQRLLLTIHSSEKAIAMESGARQKP